MALTDFIGTQNIETGLTLRVDRYNKFRLTRKHSREGVHVYILENEAQKQRIAVERPLFDQFRAILCQVVANTQNYIDKKLLFKEKPQFHFISDPQNPAQIVIQQLVASMGVQGSLTTSRDALPALMELLFDRRLQHPNDVLCRIVDYHKLFQFTFAEGSESITSNLALRKDILGDVVNFYPTHGRMGDEGRYLKEDDGATHEVKLRKEESDQKNDQKIFQSRLGDRHSDKRYQVDYERLFGSNSPDDAVLHGERSQKRERSTHFFPLPLMASEIKAFRKLPFRCEFATEDVAALRDTFLKDRDADLFVGFEMMDAVFKHHGRLKSYRFPLYYMHVTVKESNRQLYVEPSDNGRLYLNHVALANLVTQFSKQQEGDAIGDFFQTLLAQTIEVDKKLSRIQLTRMLPFDEDVYEKTREVLLGYQSESGLGGILGQLKLLGIECDLEAVYLYRMPKNVAPLTKAVEEDLDRITALALEYPDKYYESLLGQFLAPERDRRREMKPFCQSPMLPGALPNSTRQLIHKLNHNNVVLLEGPPGTGKTFTIQNLFLHCVNTGQRLLVVSDQKAAVHALVEKLVEYLFGKEVDSTQAKMFEQLWKTAIRVVDELPPPDTNLQGWLRLLRQMLAVDQWKEMEFADNGEDYAAKIRLLDGDMARMRHRLQQIIEHRMGQKASMPLRVAPKYAHDTTLSDIKGLTNYVELIKTHPEFANIMNKAIKHREWMAMSGLNGCHELFSFPEELGQAHQVMRAHERLLLHVLQTKPRSLQQFVSYLHQQPKTPLTAYLTRKWVEKFPPNSHWLFRSWRVFKSWWKHPLLSRCAKLLDIVQNQAALLERCSRVDKDVIEQIRFIHASFAPDGKDPLSLSLEVSRRILAGDREATNVFPAVQELLLELDRLQSKRDAYVKKQYVSVLTKISRRLFVKGEKNPTNLATKISALLDDLKNASHLDAAMGTWRELQQALYDAFPIWICRKQAVPFLLPCVSQSFDLVVVDEATQCRVDDALPLLFRARKIMVVGDEKQTVLAKNSSLDDYLYQEFELDEHLRNTQASGMKGGGSHIFALVKKIKQASVMLDEHYRCPPDIIQFSNRYVYHNELKIMQWGMDGSAPAVVIDWSEKKCSDSGKRYNGKFKGIETDMIDRFLAWVADTIKKIEKETGRPINMETDVALCYFLLKNEPYIKEVKSEWLRRLDRGTDVLDGAGAALQGKEREYIFFLWDINRGNMMAFRQGDMEDKRKGELNVLMSRPKRRAYHYLHRSFDHLDHRSASITDYLWTAYQNQSKKAERISRPPRATRPPRQPMAWTRSSAQVMEALLAETLKRYGTSTTRDASRYKVQPSVVVGDPKHRIDMMLVPKDNKGGTAASVAIIDLAGFAAHEHTAQDIVDYYFQLKRANPPIQPIFAFMNDLVDERGTAVQQLVQEIADKKVA